MGYDTRDRLTFDGVASYTYDDNGNVLSKFGEATYGWNFDNRMTSVTMADGTTVAYAYEAYGNRVQTRRSASSDRNVDDQTAPTLDHSGEKPSRQRNDRSDVQRHLVGLSPDRLFDVARLR